MSVKQEVKALVKYNQNWHFYVHKLFSRYIDYVTSRSGDDATEEPTSIWYVTSQRNNRIFTSESKNEEKSAKKAAEGKRKTKNKDEDSIRINGLGFEVYHLCVSMCERVNWCTLTVLPSIEVPYLLDLMLPVFFVSHYYSAFCMSLKYMQ
uniref:uncharacterized protein LOC113474433 n=1 Tax=Ciona intestinalis TaxID=7719 RepID=UPI000EF49E35|nr:uncharacterized protein LOC113474433 [Ciona intestinalis]|eukprot:XP_026691276.1 uncharacterized protein LOC113474433 [Ciona intestinalis]